MVQRRHNYDLAMPPPPPPATGSHFVVCGDNPLAYRIARELTRRYGEDVVVLLQSRPETVWASRAAQPLAMPKARAVDHVFEHLGRIVPGTRPER